MNQLANPFLMMVPQSLIGPLVMFLIMAGGMAIVVGARRVGAALVIAAIAIPFVKAIVAALTNGFLAILPDVLALPVSFLLTLFGCLYLVWLLIKWLIGQKAVDEAKGHLLADAIKSVLRFLIKRPVKVLVSVFFLFLVWASA